MGSCRSALSSDHKLTYYGCLRFPPTFINNHCKVFAPSRSRSDAGTGSSARAFNQARSQSLAVLDNSVWLVHTAALDLKPDPRSRTEVTKGGRGEVGGGGRRDGGTAWRSSYPSGLRRRKEKHSSSSFGAHAAHALWCVARPPQLPAVSPPTVWKSGWVEGARGEKAG